MKKTDPWTTLLRENGGRIPVEQGEGLKLYLILADGDFRESICDVAGAGSGWDHATGYMNGYIAGKGQAPSPRELFHGVENTQSYVSDEYDAFYLKDGYLVKESSSRGEGVKITDKDLGIWPSWKS